MNIYSIYYKFVDNNYDGMQGLSIRVGTNYHEEERKLKDDLCKQGNMVKDSFKVVMSNSLSLQALGKIIKPELEDLVKKADSEQAIRDLLDKI